MSFNVEAAEKWLDGELSYGGPRDADFYVGRGEEAEWLGSIAYDGYPDGINADVFKATSEGEYRALVEEFLDTEDYSTKPEQGWPWPWNDSRATDYAYAFEDGKVYASSFGHDWFVVDLEAEYFGEPQEDEDEWVDYATYEASKTAVFPDMSLIKNTAYDQRSGAIFISTRRDGA